MHIWKMGIVILAMIPISWMSFSAEKELPTRARKEKVLRERASKDQEFSQSATSPMAALSRHTILPESVAWLGTFPTGVSTQPQSPSDTCFCLAYRDQEWIWECRDGKSRPQGVDTPVTQGKVLSSMEFRLGTRTVLAIPSQPELILILFDPSRPEHREFHGLQYFPYRSQYAVHATLHPLPHQETVSLLTSRQLRKEYIRYAEIRFSLHGKQCHLTAFKATSAHTDVSLFIPFRDTTTGKETYAAGRFLEIPDPGEGGFILDLNSAFNPLCNYADGYNCPRPPSENSLPVPVRAGEKTYPAHSF